MIMYLIAIIGTEKLNNLAHVISHHSVDVTPLQSRNQQNCLLNYVNLFPSPFLFWNGIKMFVSSGLK
jgi:hypothetical protein